MHLTWGEIDDTSRPLALLVHGFPDTPHTWRHLGPALAAEGFRVAAPWLRGYAGDFHSGPISSGTYARDLLDLYDELSGDQRCLLIGHDWGANAAYGAVVTDPARFARLVTLAVPPAATLASGLFGYDQLRRSWYMWFAQQVGLAEHLMAAPGFWERLWADWSPGYDATEDIAALRVALAEPGRMAAALAPYRATFQPAMADPEAVAEQLATLGEPGIPTLYLHGADDGCLGAELVARAVDHLPAPGSRAHVLKDCGHFLHRERPGEVLAIVLAWLAL